MVGKCWQWLASVAVLQGECSVLSGLGLTVVVYGSPSCFINLPIVF